MGFKPWRSVGVLFVASAALVGCNNTEKIGQTPGPLGFNRTPAQQTANPFQPTGTNGSALQRSTTAPPQNAYGTFGQSTAQPGQGQNPTNTQSTNPYATDPFPPKQPTTGYSTPIAPIRPNSGVPPQGLPTNFGEGALTPPTGPAFPGSGPLNVPPPADLYRRPAN